MNFGKLLEEGDLRVLGRRGVLPVIEMREATSVGEWEGCLK